jgi:tetratricopeptide (TPR) repeat protein
MYIQARIQNRAAQLAAVVALTLLVLSTAGCDRLKARDQLNKGIRAYKMAQYTQAAEFFKQACAYDPKLPVARLYLATAYAQQFIPGAESAENTKMGERAIEEFKKVLVDEPNNANSVAGIASIYFNMKRLDDAKTWYQKQIQIDPSNPEAYYSIGVIGWSQTYPERMKVKAEHNIQQEAPIKDAKIREPLCEKNMPIIEEAFKNLNKAVELRPDYDDAMAYVNLMYREKADCQADPGERDKLNKIADTWVDKLMEVKKKKAEAAAKTGGGLVTGQ